MRVVVDEVLAPLSRDGVEAQAEAQEEQETQEEQDAQGAQGKTQLGTLAAMTQTRRSPNSPGQFGIPVSQLRPMSTI